MIELINETVKKLDGDIEHDQYVLMDLMVKIKIDPKDPEAFHFLYLVMCEEIGILIDEISPGEKSLPSKLSKHIKNIETIQDTIQGFYMEREEYA